jgi:hypothetical protein
VALRRGVQPTASGIRMQIREQDCRSEPADDALQLDNPYWSAAEVRARREAVARALPDRGHAQPAGRGEGHGECGEGELEAGGQN